ncbi:MAG: DNA mismatch repair endonuclease MutL [Bacteroidota bacterium]|nr:DNA mismatch repair endonuclease MutL [Bacteroidota bacterium]
MSDIIQLLPDSVANQIAAGEVIQRPASVVKELLENAIDAEADSIILNIKDAGRTLIEVIDDGKGMSETDARMAFERHATSKITDAPDLFQIQTMGFRGEALASVSAISDVLLKTKLHGEDLGVEINIKASQLMSHEIVSCQAGSVFSVRNLFFNVPARRKFLKKNATEYQHILSEFRKVALAYPEKNFQLISDDAVNYDLKAGSLHNRIAGFYGKNIKSSLVKTSSETEFLKITGYVSKPDIAKKRKGEQFFFVNRRFMKNPYFFKAVMLAYEDILKPEYFPGFFLYFEIDPDRIDVNIHPAKTEINFEDAKGVFSVIRATVKEALGMFNIVPSIDFDTEGMPDIPYHKSGYFPDLPEQELDQNYNPFKTEQSYTSKTFKSRVGQSKNDPFEMSREHAVSDFENEDKQEKLFYDSGSGSSEKYMQIGGRYIATPVKSGLMLISIKRAQERIKYEEYLQEFEHNTIASQQLIYPVEIALDTPDYELFLTVKEQVEAMGFQIGLPSDSTITIEALPSYFERMDESFLVEEIINMLKDEPERLEENFAEAFAGIVACTAALKYERGRLAPEEIQRLTAHLFSCQMPNYTKSGLKVIEIVTMDFFNSRFGK